MSSQEIPSYVSPAFLGSLLNVEQGDERIIEIAAAANSEISLKVKPHTETFPVEPGSPVYREIRRVGSLYARHLWYQRFYNHEQAAAYKNMYDDAVQTLMTSLVVEPTTRRDPIAVERTDFRGERLVPYSQIGFAGQTENLY